MPITLDEIPLKSEITERGGPITLFFRYRWEQLRSHFALTPTVVNDGASSVLAAALPTTTIYTTTAGGRYLVGVSLKRTAADGAASSLQATWGWTQGGAAMTHVGRLNNTDSTGADPTDSLVPIEVDVNSPITLAIAYTSTTPGNMKYTYAPVVLQLA